MHLSDARPKGAARPMRGSWSWPASSMLGALGELARQRILALGAMAEYTDTGYQLMREGDTTTSVYILLDGVVKVTGRTQSNKDALLAVRVGGDIVGELAAFDGGPRSATVETCGVVIARVVKQAEFLDCLSREPQIARAVNRAVAGKLRAANARRLDFAGSDVMTRLARVLYDIAMRYGQRAGNQALIAWPLTQPELAGLTGAAEVTVNKALRQLRLDGIVDTGYRSTPILDLDRLRAIAYP